MSGGLRYEYWRRYGIVASGRHRGARNPPPLAWGKDSAEPEAIEADAPVAASASGKNKMWSVYGKDYIGCEESVRELPAGQYVPYMMNDGRAYLTKMTITTDSLLRLPDSASEKVMKEVQVFWEKEQRFRDRGFLHKRGVLLWGPPGGGKTSALHQLGQKLHEMGGISIYANSPTATSKAMQLVRTIEPKRPMFVMMEDMDALVREYGESQWLAILDGELQIDNVVFIATTNYPERMDARFINRPSRFDSHHKIGMPSEAARRLYIGSKMPDLSEEELTSWVEQTNGFSIAHLKELVTSVDCFEVKVEEAVLRLRTMMDRPLKSDDYSDKTFGFAGKRGG